MLKAQQQSLFQSANDQLLSIRQSELDYYYNYFGTFSNLAALAASLTINTVTQVQAYNYNDIARGLKSWFWMSAVITICLGSHCVVLTSITQVFGLGLAIKGPLGSMVRAVNGCKKVSSKIFKLFVLSMIGYYVTNVATYWMVAFTMEACMCTAILTVSAIITFQHSISIANKFHWNDVDYSKVDGDWDGSAKPPPKRDASMSGGSINSKALKDSLLQNSVLNENKAQGFSNSMSVKTEDSDDQDYKEGYVRVLMHSGGNESGTWERCYCVVSDKCLWFYTSKKAFDSDPESPIKSRPVQLESYGTCQSSEKPNSFMFTLMSKPDDVLQFKNWEFAVDTSDERDEWVVFLKTQMTV